MTDEKKKGGWVKISRAVLEHWVWDEKPFSKGQAWIDLILLARHNDGTFMDRRGNLIEGKRGGIYRSERSLSERWKWSRKKTSNFLSRLVQDHMIEICKRESSGETIIFIVNYDKFQSGEANNRERTWELLGKEEGTDRDQNGASIRAAITPGNNKEFQLSGASERAGQEPVESQSRTSREPVENTYKNIKNIKNEKKKEYICQEPGIPAPDCSEIFLPLVDGTFYNVPFPKIRNWEAAFPAVDVMHELKKMLTWLDSNQTKRKTARGIERFINNWLSRAQDNGGSKQESYKPFPPTTKDGRILE